MKRVIVLNFLGHRSFIFIVASCMAFCILVMSVAAQTGISYVYDELGRLIAVIDPAGDTARYSYDAIGNVLSISRHSSSTLSLINFTPTSGPIGSEVTIYGTAFSTTPSQNTVTFNGTAATVVSSTATKIVATVPSGATTGAISVATTASPVTSTVPFTVVAGSGAPTITSFSPTIGSPGGAVTITGTNFQTPAVKNKTRFNITTAVVDSASATSISTNVPSLSGSGKIKVSTPSGTAVSADDFFVPPSPFSASDVIATGSMSSGNSQSVTFSTAGKIGLFVFEASANQRASVKVTSSSISTSKISILTPTGQSAGWGYVGTGNTGFVDSQTFSMSGTHTIAVSPNGSNTGSITFALYVFNDVAGTITAGGSSVTSTTTVPGQNGRFLFTGTMNQRVSLKITGVSLTGGNNYCIAAIKNPNGTTLEDQNFYTNAFINTVVLPSTGTYTLLVDPGTSTTGSVTLTLYDVPPDSNAGTVTFQTGYGIPQPATFSTPGQNSYVTVEGLLGQRISLNLGNVLLSGGTSFYTVYVRKPDGTTLTSLAFAGAGFVDILTLPVDGTYLVIIDPSDSAIGNISVTVHDVPADTTGTITPGGSAVTVTNAHPGQNGTLTFSGTANQRVSVRLNGVSFTGGSFCWAYLKRPDGSTLGSVFFNSGGGFIDIQTLPSTGPYTILIDPQDGAIGSVNVTLYEVPADSTGSVTVGGSAVNAATTVPGQNAELTFAGTASQQVTVQVTGSTMSCVAVTLKQPNGSSLTTKSSCAGSFNLNTQTLPTTGTYTIKIDPSGANTGSMNVTVINP